ncbi:MAG: hypothetical protein ACJARD_000507 [Alphaproteobacteria bacterium]|jgi:hypothetical protein
MMTLIYSKLCNFIKDKRAIALPIFAGIAFTAITLTTTAIDVNYYVQAKRALQAIADQSVLTAATQGIEGGTGNQDALKICRDTFNDGITNNPQLKDIYISDDIECAYKDQEIANLGADKRIIELRGEVEIKTLFASNLGLGTFKVELLAAASRDRNNTEVIFAFSQQGTMCSQTTDDNNDGLIEITNDPTCAKFEAVKTGIQDSIAAIGERLNTNWVSVGLVPYNYKVAFPDRANIPPTFTNLETEVDFFEIIGTLLDDIEPLSDNLVGVSTAVGNMEQPRGQEAWGRSDLAIHTAALMLDTTQKQYFNNHTVKAWHDARKYVVLMADGANIGCCYTNQPRDNYSNQYTYHYIPYNEHMLHICEELKKQNVHIFTVFLNPGAINGALNEMNNVMARCASGQYADPTEEADPTILLTCKDKDFCFDINEISEISDAYEDIVAVITKPVIDF